VRVFLCGERNPLRQHRPGSAWLLTRPAADQNGQR
jgi:hypothetical protein